MQKTLKRAMSRYLLSRFVIYYKTIFRLEAVSCFLLEGVGDSCEQQTHFRSTRNASAVRRLGGREKAMSVFKVL